jgi:hypothetical protein
VQELLIAADMKLANLNRLVFIGASSSAENLYPDFIGVSSSAANLYPDST